MCSNEHILLCFFLTWVHKGSECVDGDLWHSGTPLKQDVVDILFSFFVVSYTEHPA